MSYFFRFSTLVIAKAEPLVVMSWKRSCISSSIGSKSSISSIGSKSSISSIGNSIGNSISGGSVLGLGHSINHHSSYINHNKNKGTINIIPLRPTIRTVTRLAITNNNYKYSSFSLFSKDKNNAAPLIGITHNHHHHHHRRCRVLGQPGASVAHVSSQTHPPPDPLDLLEKLTKGIKYSKKDLELLLLGMDELKELIASNKEDSERALKLIEAMTATIERSEKLNNIMTAMVKGARKEINSAFRSHSKADEMLQTFSNEKSNFERWKISLETLKTMIRMLWNK